MGQPTKYYEDLCFLLVPHGLYFQRRTLDDKSVQGYPLEPGLLAVAAVLFGIFASSFIVNIMKEAGATLAKSVTSALKEWLHRSLRDKQGALLPPAQIPEEYLDEVCNIIRKYSQTIAMDSESLRLEIVSRMRNYLTVEGLPSRLAEPVAEEAINRITIILDIHFSNNK